MRPSHSLIGAMPELVNNARQESHSVRVWPVGGGMPGHTRLIRCVKCHSSASVSLHLAERASLVEGAMQT